jgi:hypothetical protein
VIKSRPLPGPLIASEKGVVNFIEILPAQSAESSPQNAHHCAVKPAAYAQKCGMMTLFKPPFAACH